MDENTGLLSYFPFIHRDCFSSLSKQFTVQQVNSQSEASRHTKKEKIMIEVVAIKNQ